MEETNSKKRIQLLLSVSNSLTQVKQQLDLHRADLGACLNELKRQNPKNNELMGPGEINSLNEVITHANQAEKAHRRFLEQITEIREHANNLLTREKEKNKRTNQ